MRTPKKTILRDALLSCVAAGMLTTPALAETHVVTYVTKVQEERRSTRWTLTEWLRIKERMRMMDLWLALFSDPKKDKFRPELNLQYGVTQGIFSLTDSSGEWSGKAKGTQARAELWLTNILTATTGVRALNIDFGIEGWYRGSGDITPESVAALADQAVAGQGAAAPGGGGGSSPLLEARSLANRYGAANLRLFGKSIQDTSLVIKYGQYTLDNGLPAWTDEDESKRFTGVMAGADLDIYLTSFLGLEGNYLSFGNATNPRGGEEVRGTYVDYSAFVEVSLLRLMIGNYREQWSFANDGNETKTSETGFVGGAKLQF